MAKKKRSKSKRTSGTEHQCSVGCYGTTSEHVLLDVAKAHKEPPATVHEAFDEKDADWDYCIYKDWVVMRLFDDGVETKRIIAYIHKSRLV